MHTYLGTSLRLGVRVTETPLGAYGLCQKQTCLFSVPKSPRKGFRD